MFQNQPFIDLLRNRCFWIIPKIQRKKPVLEFLFSKAAVPRSCNFIKEDSDTVAFLLNLQSFRIYKFSEQLFWKTYVNVLFQILFKKRLQHRCFPGNFVNYSRTKIVHGVAHVSFAQNFLKFDFPFCGNFCSSSFQRKLKMQREISQCIIKLLWI